MRWRYSAQWLRAGGSPFQSESYSMALWALDLTSAYRRMAAARHEWWMQCFLWHAGVRLDSRCELGSVHLVDLFQRISSLVMAVA